MKYTDIIWGLIIAVFLFMACFMLLGMGVING